MANNLGITGQIKVDINMLRFENSRLWSLKLKPREVAHKEKEEQFFMVA